MLRQILRAGDSTLDRSPSVDWTVVLWLGELGRKKGADKL
jgi:hypothetical protein